MNWNNITLAMNITGHDVNDSGPKLNVSPVRPTSVAAFESWSTVMPLANFGRFAANWPASKKMNPKTAMSAQPTTPSTVSQVTILWNVRVGCRTTKATSAMTTSPASMPGMTVITPLVTSVYQPISALKNSLPVP